MKLKNFRKFLKRVPWHVVAIFFFIFLLFLVNTFHEEYPDEYDSITGGLYITQGRLPYRDWFQHHQPLAYVLASILLPFGGRSFVRFRVLLALAFFALNIGAYFVLKKRFKKRNLNFYLVYLVVLALSTTYFWGQMLLADTLAAYLIIPVYALLLLSEFYQKKFESCDLLIVSLFAFFAWLTSLSYMFLLAGLNVYALYLFFKSERQKQTANRKIFKKAVLILGLPYLVFFLYLVSTKSLGEWFFANITYNQRYYIYNYPKPPGAPINPMRYAIVIAYNFFGDFFPLLASVKNFVFENPFNVTLAISNAIFFIYLLLKKRYVFLFPFLITLVYSSVRSSPFGIHETDYQASVYILTSFVNGIFVFFALKESLDKREFSYSRKVIGSVLLIILSIYWFFNSFFIFLRFSQKFYPKYMGELPLIYDRPKIAPIINQLVDKDEYSWVGPFEFKELFYLQTKVPSKYHWFLDHAVKSEKIKNEMIADFTKNKPKVIVFKRNYTPWGGDASTFNYFFTDFLDENYFRIFMLNQELEGFEYKWQIGNPRDFDIDGDFNFDKARRETIIRKLLDLGLIKEVARIK